MPEDSDYEDDDRKRQMKQMFSGNVDPSLVRYLVDFEEVIDSLRLMLSGKDIDYQHDPPEMISFGNPLMNSHGIGRVISKLKIAHKGVPVSNFHKDTPYTLTRLQTFTIARELFVNMEEYAIKNEDDMMKIVELVMVTLFSMYSRAVLEGERKFIKGYTKESHVIGPERKGRLSLT